MMLNKKLYLADVLTKGLIAALALLVCTVSQAQLRVADVGSIEKRVLDCANLETDTARLACYDSLSEDLALVMSSNESTRSSSEALSNAAASSDSDGRASESDKVRTTSAATSPDSTGIDPTTGVPNTASKPKQGETFDTDVERKQSIRVMIEKTKRNKRGDWYFYFDNGEVWKQIDTRRRRIPPLPVPATVSRGLFSSYKLHIDGQVWTIKVRRLK